MPHAHCDTCGAEKMRHNAGDETFIGWPRCVNKNCPAYGESRASVSFRKSDTCARCQAETEGE